MSVAPTAQRFERAAMVLGELSEKFTHLITATAVCCLTATVAPGLGMVAGSETAGVIGVVEALLGGAMLGHLLLRKHAERFITVAKRCAREVDAESDRLLDSDYRSLPAGEAKRDAAIAAIRAALPRLQPTADELVGARLTEARVAAYYLDRAAAVQPYDFSEIPGNNDPEDAARRDLGRRLLAAVVTKAYGVVVRQPEFRDELFRQSLAELLRGQDALQEGVTAANAWIAGVKDDTAAIRAMLAEVLARGGAAPAPLIERAADEVVAAATADIRLEVALERLQYGDIAGAEAAFRAVAQEKATRIARDRQDAAAAYRHLGLIALAGDQRKALDAFLQALQFDDDDIDSLLWAAFLSFERGLLGEAERHYRRIPALAEAGATAWHSYWALLGLGDVYQGRGNLTTARQQYELAQSLARRLAAADPDNAGWQRDLSVSDNKIGDVLVAQGNLPEALKAFRDGLEIARRLAAADPDNAGWQRDLAVSHGKLAIFYSNNGETTASRAQAAAGRAIIALLVERFPDWAQWRRDLAMFDRLLAED